MNVRGRLDRMRQQLGERGDPSRCHCGPAYIVAFDEPCAVGRDDVNEAGPGEVRCAACGRMQRVYAVPIPGRGDQPP